MTTRLGPALDINRPTIPGLSWVRQSRLVKPSSIYGQVSCASSRSPGCGVRRRHRREVRRHGSRFGTGGHDNALSLMILDFFPWALLPRSLSCVIPAPRSPQHRGVRGMGAVRREISIGSLSASCHSLFQVREVSQNSSVASLFAEFHSRDCCRTL